MEETLYNVQGQPQAYIAYDDESTIYLWEGVPVAYLEYDDIYGFNGLHLGWFEDGVVRDHAGSIVGFNGRAATVSVAFESFKAFKAFKPFKAFKQFAPFKPFYNASVSELELVDFLMQGRK